MTRAWWAAVIAVALLIAGCGDDSGGSVDENGASGDNAAPLDATADATDLEESVDDLTEDLEQQQQAQGGGTATLTVGDQTWTFAPLLCAFGVDQTGQEGTEFVLSSIQDGMQMYAAVDSFGHSISIDDIENFETPSVSLSTTGDGFISIDGKNVTADAEFIDGTTDDFSSTPGQFSATCP